MNQQQLTQNNYHRRLYQFFRFVLAISSSIVKIYMNDFTAECWRAQDNLSYQVLELFYAFRSILSVFHQGRSIL